MISAKDLNIGPRPSEGATTIDTAPALPRLDPVHFWSDRGFEPQADDGGNLIGTIPAGVIAISGDAMVKGALIGIVKHLGPPCFTVVGNTFSYFFRVVAGFPGTDAIAVPPGVVIAGEGAEMRLPSGEDFKPDSFRAASASDLPLLGRDHPWYHLKQPAVAPEIQHTPLSELSLRGRAAEFEESVTAPTPLLGGICLAGQSTLLYAPPNGGKTATVLRLVMDAVEAKRIAPGNVYYINADDNSAGFATKLRLMDDIGVHTLCPGFNGFKAEDLGPKLSEMGRKGTAAGTLTIIDTSKKFADLMSKKEASKFAQACRLYVMGGGAIVALAHTNKNPSASGKLTYAGTTDLLEDFDAAYLGTPLQGGVTGKDKVLKFEALKRRGPSVGEVAYAFPGTPCDSYEQLLASIREVDPEQLEDFERQEAELVDSEVIAHVEWCVINGFVKKMELAKAVAERASVSKRAALKVIEGYTGDDPKVHRWCYRVRDRGAKVFELLPRECSDQTPV